MHRQPNEPCDLLAGVGRKRLPFRDHIVEVAKIPQKAMLLRISEPFDSIGQQRDRRIAHRESLHRPAVVPNHHFVERISFLGTPDEEITPQLRNCDHDSRLSHQPRLCRCVIHHTSTPGNRPLELRKFAPENKTKITKLLGRGHRKLLLALFILSKAGEVVQNSEAEPDCEIWPLVFIPPRKTSLRYELCCLNSVFDRSVRCSLCILWCRHRHIGWVLLVSSSQSGISRL